MLGTGNIQYHRIIAATCALGYTLFTRSGATPDRRRTNNGPIANLLASPAVRPMNVGTASRPIHPVVRVEPRYITINGKIARVEQRCADCARLVTRGSNGREVHAS